MRKSERIFPGKGGRQAGELGNLLGIAGVMGLHMVTCPLVGAAIGYGLDRWLGTKFLLVVMLILGVVAGFRCVLQDARRLQRLDKDREHAEQRNSPADER